MTTLATVFSVLLVALGLFHTNSANRAQQETTEQGQVTQRFTTAIDQVGSDKVDVRVGGIYALERLMRDSPGDQPAIVAVLTTYVREHASRSTMQTLPSQAASPSNSASIIGRPAADVQAALTVLGRRPDNSAEFALDLSGTDLKGAHLDGADLSGADLTLTDLSFASLWSADLSDASMHFAELEGTTLTYANFSRAFMRYVNLNDATLFATNFADVDLTGTYGLNTAELQCADIDEGTALAVGVERPVPRAFTQLSSCRDRGSFPSPSPTRSK